MSAGTRFIAVILGAPAGPGGERIREQDGMKLLGWLFDNFKTVRPGAIPLEPVRLWKGREKSAQLQIEGSLNFTAPAHRAASLYYTLEMDSQLIAPLPASFPVGWLVISDNQGELHRTRLYTAMAYRQGNIFRRIWDSIVLFFSGI